jgi:oxygen-independent coproporphyrinogen-3 oxidase
MEHGSQLFENLSVDIIVGLPGVRSDEWKEMIKQIVAWPIKHVSMYFLTIHEDTQLYFGIQSKKVTLPTDDEVVDLYYWTIDEFAAAGLEQYEISNFSRPGWHSKHNSVYWQRQPYKGFGMGACSFDGKRRTKNTTNLLKYLEEIRHTGKSIVFEEALTDEQVWLEQLMLGLRQRKGLHVATILEPLSLKKREEFSSKAEQLMAARLVSEADGMLRLTPRGLSVANEIIVKLSCL